MKIAVYMLVLIASFNLNAGYFSFGGTYGKSKDSTYGAGVGIAGGFEVYDKYSLGLAFEQAIYGQSKNPRENINNLKKAYTEMTNSSDGEGSSNISASIKPIEGSSSFTALYTTLRYDIGGKRGLYAFGGLGYGAQFQVKKNTGSLAGILDKIEKFKDGSSSSNQALIDELLQDPNFINDMKDIANNPALISNIVNQLLPNSQNIIDQVSSYDKIMELVNDKSKMEVFLDNVNDRVEANKSHIENISPKKLICDNLVDCKHGIAYQLGVGYDIPIYKALGLDVYGKVNGLFVTNPILSVGANLIFVF